MRVRVRDERLARLQLELLLLLGRHRVRLGDDRHDVHVAVEPTHECEVDVLEAMGRDEVEAHVDEPVVVAEPLRVARAARGLVGEVRLEERLDVVTDIGETTKLVMLLAELGFRAEARRRTALLAAQPLETVQDRIRIIGLLIELGDQEAARRRARSLARDDSLLPPDRIDLAEQLIRLSDDATAESLLERAIRGGEGGERLRFRRLRLLKGIDLRRERVEADAREGGS